MSTKPTDGGDAHQPTPTAQRSDGGDPEIPNPRVNRREMLKITGATGAATVGLSGAGPASITGDTEAIAPVVAGAPVFAAAAGAGHYLANYDIDGDTEVDENDVLEDQLYETAASVADGREEFVDEMDYEFVESPSEPTDTPHGRVAWEEIRVAAVRSIVNGESVSEAESEAKEALDKQTTRAVINIVERWNTGIKALSQQFVLQAENDVEVFADDGDYIVPHILPESEVAHPDAEPLEAGQPESAASDESILWEYPLDDLPTDPTSLEGRDEPLSQIVLGRKFDGSENWTCPNPAVDNFADFERDALSSGSDPVEATHSDLEDFTLIDNGLYIDAIETIKSAYNSITDDLSTYVQNLNDGIEQGAIAPADILGPSEIAAQFEDSDHMTRLATELVAIGAQVPDAAGYRATISHDDLQADELEGLVFPQFSVDDPPSVNSGVTISSADYELAYFGYESALSSGDGEDDETELRTEVLSGNHDLEIISVDGVEGQETVDDSSRGDEAEADGRVVLWSGDGAPDPLADPDEYPDYRVVVEGETTTDAQDVGNVVEDGEDYVLETSALAEGETIDQIELIPPVEHERSHDYTADATQVDTEEMLNRLENQQELIEDLEEELEDDDGANWWPSAPGTPSVDDFAGQLAGIVVIAVIVVSVVWSVVSDAVPFLGN